MSTYGIGLSGGDRIWIELAKRITKKYPSYIYLWEDGMTIAKREGLDNVEFVLWSAAKWKKFGFFVNYLARIFISLLNAFTLRINNSPNTIVYSASEFWQDSLPAIILKVRFPHIKWLAAWYQTAPNPFVGYDEGKKMMRYRFKAFLYWLVQLPVKPLIRNFADIVIVNNENERKEYPALVKQNKVFVMLGAVDLNRINAYRLKHKKVKTIYDSVFQGRFHPQKGVMELIDIWKIVVALKTDAKLAMIGDGPLMKAIKLKIKKLKLENNIKLFGYLFDGSQKYKIFSQSRTVLHPAFYDSGGMAAAEAMAFGIPAVGFNLKAYDSYYPKGMVKAKVGDIQDFAKKVLELLDNPNLRYKIGKEGLKMLDQNWSWQTRVENLIKFIQ